MKEKKTTEVFSMSFLDIMACGFGALVLILLISEFNEVEIIENKYHKWFLGVQFHPELKSKPFKPHPIFFSFIKNSLMNKNA